jgi:sugar O-acyltransferase (sialic acid O-acetyltransferase NeuD family)
MKNKTKNIVLIGGGNQAHYTMDIIEKQGQYKVVGIIDSLHDIGTLRFGVPIIGRQENLQQLVFEYKIECGVITIGDNWSRFLVSEQIKKSIPDFSFPNIIHPSVIIGGNVNLGSGNVIMAGCIINPKAVIGNFCFFATGAQIEHDCVICDYASVSAGSVMGGHVKIGRFSAITLGVTILDRIEIGENTVVGAASLVTKSLPANIVSFGNPAKKIRDRKIDERFLK